MFSWRQTALLLLLLVLCAQFALVVLAGTPGSNVYSDSARAFFNALKTGNYSVLEPHLSILMKAFFPPSALNKLRSQLSVYGDLVSYKLVSTSQSGKYVIAFYNARFEKAVITFKLVFDNTTGRIEGVWITRVRQSMLPSLVTCIPPAIGGILGFTLVAVLARRVYWKATATGLALLVITLAVQPWIQKYLLLLLGVKSSLDILYGSTGIKVAAMLCIGGVAGFLQEALKYLASRRKRVIEAVFVGAGFGLGEAVLFPIITVVIAIMKGQAVPPSLSLTLVMTAGMERFLILLFHATTTMAYARFGAGRRGVIVLLLVSLIHTLIDALAAYYQITRALAPAAISYALTAIATLVLYILSRHIKTVKTKSKTTGMFPRKNKSSL